MKCPYCNQEHPEEFLFCPATGKKIETKMVYTNVSQHEYDRIESFHEGRAIVRKEGKYGVIDINGNVIVPCTYSNIHRYSEGVAACQMDSDGWAFMDLNGEIVIQVAEGLDVVSDIGFMEGFCAVSGTVELDDDYVLKYGYIDKTGQLSIDLQFDYAWDFHEGLSNVSKEDEFGNDANFYINGKGQTVFPYEYLSCGDFIGGYAKVLAQHRKYIVINKDCQIIYKFKKESYWEDVNIKFISYGLGEKLLWFKPDKQDKYYFWNNVKTIYRGFSEGYIAICSSKNEKWGFITETGNEVIPFIYEGAHDFKEGLAAVKINGLWGFVDYTGIMVIKPLYDKVIDFSESRAIVQIKSKWIVIDKIGNVVVE